MKKKKICLAPCRPCGDRSVSAIEFRACADKLKLGATDDIAIWRHRLTRTACALIRCESCAAKTMAEAPPIAPICGHDLCAIAHRSAPASYMKAVASRAVAWGGDHRSARIARSSRDIRNSLCRNGLRRRSPADRIAALRTTIPKKPRCNSVDLPATSPSCIVKMLTCEDLSRDVSRRAARDRCGHRHNSDIARVKPVSMRQEHRDDAVVEHS